MAGFRVHDHIIIIITIINSYYTSCYPQPLKISAGFQTSHWLRLTITTILWMVLISRMYLGWLELERRKSSSIKCLKMFSEFECSQLLFDSVTGIKHIY